MKRCPECRRDYYDDTLLYCLEDGNALVRGSVPPPGSEPAASVGGQFDEPKTAILYSTAAPGGSDPCADTYYGTDCGVAARIGGGAAGVIRWAFGKAELFRK